MHLLFVLFDFTIVFCFAWDDYVASFCNSPFLSTEKLSHHNGHVDGFTSLGKGQNVSVQCCAVDGHALHALLHRMGVLDLDVVDRPAIPAGHGEAGHRVRDAGVDAQTVQRRLDAEDSDYVLDIKKDIGLTDSDLAGQYQYTKDIVTVDGSQRGTTVTVDENLMKWVDQTKEYTDKGYNNKSSLWDSQWASDQGPTGKVFGFFYSTWGINFTLLGNSLETPTSEGGKEEVGKRHLRRLRSLRRPSAVLLGRHLDLRRSRQR